MKKNRPITISEMDVQTISDMEIEALTGISGAAAYWSQVCECCETSNDGPCIDIDQA